MYAKVEYENLKVLKTSDVEVLRVQAYASMPASYTVNYVYSVSYTHLTLPTNREV